MVLLDWIVVAGLCLLSLAVGLHYTRNASKKGAEGYFTGNRNLPWWAIGLSNTATYQSGNGAFVMLVLAFGITGNWLWWASWIVWMPLVALIWAAMWRRMQIVTTAELITMRYGGKPALIARKVYAFTMFCFAILVIGYITGFFAKTIAPLVVLNEWQILLIFGGITCLYTLFGGLMGVVFVDVIQFIILMVGSIIFFYLAVNHHGGWAHILDTVRTVRPEGLQEFPPTGQIPKLTVIMLVVQGLFFAGSPTAGEGMTAQRFMAAKNERHAIGGQLFNAFIALSLRTIPLIGLGVIAMSLYWTKDLINQVGPAPAGLTVLEDQAYAWGELVKASHLPAGLVGLLVAAEVAAFMSTLSSLINWGSSFIVNDFYKAIKENPTEKGEIFVSRIATLGLFVFASVVSILFVEDMVDWFMFINSAMVVFILPLAWFRFFWWRFNVWGELAATILGLPLSILVWFTWGFKDKPFWMGIGMLFLTSLVTLIAITYLTPAESDKTLERFYKRCRPHGVWGRVRRSLGIAGKIEPSLGNQLLDCFLGILCCLGLVVATNAMFVQNWPLLAISVLTFITTGGALLARCTKVGSV